MLLSAKTFCIKGISGPVKKGAITSATVAAAEGRSW